jgi:hypothetical protein
MVSGKTLSYKVVESELLRLHPWVEGNYTSEDVIRAVKAVVRLAGSGNDYVRITDFVPISSSRGPLPSNFEHIDSVAITNASNLSEAEKLMCEGKLTLKWIDLNGDAFKRSWHKTQKEFQSSTGIRFIINNNYIFPNFEEGVLAIAYDGLAVDEEGYPKIPDHESWLLAAVYECAMKVADRLFYTDKFTMDKIIRLEGYRNHYVSQAGTSSRMPTKPEAVQHKNNRMSNPINTNPELDFFSTFGNTYNLKFRNS